MTPVHAYNPVQLHRTTYTNTSQVQMQYKLDEARKNTRLNTNTMKTAKTLKSYAHEHCSGETPKREANEGLAPW